jgi:hypothetical protein
MDVSFSAWQSVREASLSLKGESFSFLFDRRYTNRLNRMSRVFLEAYAKATKELATQEDRFPSLSEIDAKMESGAVYAFKDRLMKNTEFFEEIKISGVSYLVPRAERFVDISGTYTDLSFDFDQGIVVLPARRKTPVPIVSEQSMQGDVPIELSNGEPFEVSKEDAGLTPPPPFEPTTAQIQSDEPDTAYPGHPSESYTDLFIKQHPIEPKPEDTSAISLQAPPKEERAELPLPEPKTSKPPAKPRDQKKLIIAALISIFILLAISGIFMTILRPTGSASFINYQAYISNTSNESYLGLDINNPEGISNDILMELPLDIDKSISARGGAVTISHASSTLVKLNSSSDASIKVYLDGNWSSVPVDLSLMMPDGYDSSLEVHGQNYDVKRKDTSLVLSFNLTKDGVRFEQSLTPKR